ncbi:hypothetical protein BZA05DRAFT_475411 [Tricharina praecox]|uniref:uncharacterized protein n=1 Tax=Tricharina praecox TaxID=43433 RepID=UPI002220D7D7|nr:uncharacterized protein BZA05DRAFT_475411 [Tricharina praecox]KAI5848346.1 hypothetical protein BZA05DRAFT_475411 [Tricharina praecox]
MVRPSGRAGMGKRIAVIERKSIHHDPGCDISQREAEVLTSYDILSNWRNTLVVPGCPPIWSPPPLPIRIPADKDEDPTHPRQPARLNFPTCPLEPLFRALPITRPTLSLRSFDIITDRHSLRELLAFLGSDAADFQINAEVVANTLLLSGQARFWGSASDGYGKSLERRFTRRQECSRESVMHCRAVGYTLGGLRLLVRFEVDACIGEEEAAAEEVELEPPREVPVTPTGVRIVPGGVLVPEESIVELKSKAKGKRYIRQAEQLWFSRTPILIIGYHEGGGNIVEVEQRDVEKTGWLEKWELTNTEKLQKLVRALEMLRTVMVVRGGRFAVVTQKRQSALSVYEMQKSSQFGLPEDIKAGWK